MAFGTRFDGSGAGVFTGNGGALTTITTAAIPPFGNPFQPPSINEAGMVAFSAGDSILAGNGGPLDDRGHFGSTITGFLVSPTSLNDSGQVAFVYGLANGTTGIAIANPVPEPGSLSLLFGGLLAVFVPRCRRAQ